MSNRLLLNKSLSNKLLSNKSVIKEKIALVLNIRAHLEHYSCNKINLTCWGIPSVMQTISGTSASSASIIAAAAPGGGTQMTVASGLVALTAWKMFF